MMMPLPCWENCYHHPAIMIRVRKKVSFIFLLLLFFSILYPPHLWQVDRWNINELKIKTQFIQKKKAPYETGEKYTYLQRIFIQHIQNGILLFAPNQIDLVENCKNQLFTIFLFFFVLEHFFFFCPTCYAFHIFISMEKLAGSFWAKPTHSIDDIISFCLSRTWEMYRYTLFLIQHNSVGCVSPF